MHIVAKRATTEGDMGGTAMGHRPSAFRAFLLAPIAFAISPSLAHAHGDVTSNADSLRVLLSEWRSEEHTSELQSLMRISYAVFCLKKKKNTYIISHSTNITIKLMSYII